MCSHSVISSFISHIFTWDESDFCRKVISWSSTSWRGSRLYDRAVERT